MLRKSKREAARRVGQQVEPALGSSRVEPFLAVRSSEDHPDLRAVVRSGVGTAVLKESAPALLEQLVERGILDGAFLTLRRRQACGLLGGKALE